MKKTLDSIIELLEMIVEMLKEMFLSFPRIN